MIVYSGLKSDFLTAVEQDSIATEIEENIYNKMHRRSAQSEFRSWENSLEYMYKVLNDAAIPVNSGIAIEYNIPQTSKRVDFIISGYGENKDPNVVIIELKQWDKVDTIYKLGKKYAELKEFWSTPYNLPTKGMVDFVEMLWREYGKNKMKS